MVTDEKLPLSSSVLRSLDNVARHTLYYLRTESPIVARKVFNLRIIHNRRSYGRMASVSRDPVTP